MKFMEQNSTDRFYVAILPCPTAILPCLTAILPCPTVMLSGKHEFKIQSTLVISNSKGLSEILRDIRTSTYQICRIEEKIIRTATFSKNICNLILEVSYIY